MHKEPGTTWMRFWQTRSIQEVFSTAWSFFWMQFAGLSYTGRLATWLATWFAPPYKARRHLARYNSKGYIAPNAKIYHPHLRLDTNVFIGDRVIIFQAENGGAVELGDRVHIHQDTCIETGDGGSVKIAAKTHIQPRCQFSAYKGSIEIGRGVQIAPNCAFYPYNHGIAPDAPIQQQQLQTKGKIAIEDDAWLGCGVIVLDGVRIGKGAVIGAGAVVNSDVPDGAIATGVPARVVNTRSNLAPPRSQSETGNERLSLEGVSS